MTSLSRPNPGFRAFFVGFLIIILLIPALLVSWLIDDRESYQRQAQNEIADKWGKAQVVSGLYVTVPYLVWRKDNQGKRVTYTYYAHLMPDDVTVETQVDPQIRYRGIYSVRLYEADIKLRSKFTKETIESYNKKYKNLQWNKMAVALAVSDLRGVTETLVMKESSQEFHVDPGISTAAFLESGVEAFPGITLTKSRVLEFSTKLQLKGSSSLSFLPLGRKTTVKIKSSWSDPSFQGAFLPSQKKIDAGGFEAEWSVLNLNRNFPQSWEGRDKRVLHWAFGVDFWNGFGHYKKVDRAAKYAVLFLVLTFAAFFVFETVTGNTVHPIQYLLVGLALLLFYVLLLSFSEHLGFGSAYGLAAAAITVLISFYAKSVYKNVKVGGQMILILATLYGFMYALLNMGDYALLTGSLGLFVILSAIMFATRNVRWYGEA